MDDAKIVILQINKFLRDESVVFDRILQRIHLCETRELNKKENTFIMILIIIGIFVKNVVNISWFCFQLNYTIIFESRLLQL